MLCDPVTTAGLIVLNGGCATNDCNLGVYIACILGSVWEIDVNLVLPGFQIVIPDLLVAFLEVLF
jgi:hypothetical protein